MHRLLHVVVSPRQQRSESLVVTSAFVAAYRARHPGTVIDTLDLWAEPLPVFGGDRVEAKMAVIGGGDPAVGAQADAWESVRAVFARFDAADRYVFGVPMWNRGVPWVLKHYIDTITQPGLLFRFNPASGYQGLLRGKKALAVYTSGTYARGVDPAFGRDFHASYFDDWLRFAGIDDIREIHFQPTRARGGADAGRAEAVEQARRLAVVFETHDQPSGRDPAPAARG